jgi:hypothetical protein
LVAYHQHRLSRCKSLPLTTWNMMYHLFWSVFSPPNCQSSIIICGGPQFKSGVGWTILTLIELRAKKAALEPVSRLIQPWRLISDVHLRWVHGGSCHETRQVRYSTVLVGKSVLTRIGYVPGPKPSTRQTNMQVCMPLKRSEPILPCPP